MELSTVSDTLHRPVSKAADDEQTEILPLNQTETTDKEQNENQLLDNEDQLGQSTAERALSGEDRIHIFRSTVVLIGIVVIVLLALILWLLFSRLPEQQLAASATVPSTNTTANDPTAGTPTGKPDPIPNDGQNQAAFSLVIDKNRLPDCPKNDAITETCANPKSTLITMKGDSQHRLILGPFACQSDSRNICDRMLSVGNQVFVKQTMRCKISAQVTLRSRSKHRLPIALQLKVNKNRFQGVRAVLDEDPVTLLISVIADRQLMKGDTVSLELISNSEMATDVDVDRMESVTHIGLSCFF